MNCKRTHQPPSYYRARQLAAAAVKTRRNAEPRTDRHAAHELIRQSEQEEPAIVFPVRR